MNVTDWERLGGVLLQGKASMTHEGGILFMDRPSRSLMLVHTLL